MPWFSVNSTKIKNSHHDIPGKPWVVGGVDMFALNNKNYLCIVDYYSKFLIVNKAEEMSADSLILACKVIFSRFGFAEENNVRCWCQFYFR